MSGNGGLGFLSQNLTGKDAQKGDQADIKEATIG